VVHYSTYDSVVQFSTTLERIFTIEITVLFRLRLCGTVIYRVVECSTLFYRVVGCGTVFYDSVIIFYYRKNSTPSIYCLEISRCGKIVFDNTLEGCSLLEGVEILEENRLPT
jgi:hypothetical protein